MSLFGNMETGLPVKMILYEKEVRDEQLNSDI